MEEDPARRFVGWRGRCVEGSECGEYPCRVCCVVPPAADARAWVSAFPLVPSFPSQGFKLPPPLVFDYVCVCVFFSSACDMSVCGKGESVRWLTRVCIPLVVLC